MIKLAEEIWKITWCSLVAVTIIIWSFNYLNKDHWWEIDKKASAEENKNNPLVYYSIKESGEEAKVESELIVRNTVQENSPGKYGVFENILPGQIVSVRVNVGMQSVRSPSFRLQDKEIRHLVFEKRDDGLVYLNSHSRIRKVFTTTLTALEQTQEKNLFQLDILKEIGN